jgi:hypothetical protein
LASFFDSILSPIASMAVRRRADEGDAFLFQRAAKGGVLGQEAIARMHRLGAGLRRRR